MNLKHYFLPHPETHQRAHLISTGALAIYLAFFVVLHLFFGLLQQVKPDILGVSADLDQQELIRLTNAERKKAGLPELIEDPKLNVAAYQKGENMFKEQYWAHYSPSGKDPWGFILQNGYKFSYAGENLARNFSNSSEVVSAWMASSSHRDNILNNRYKNIGISILEGTLNGQPSILVVQEFGAPMESVAQVPASKQELASSLVLPPSTSIPTILPSAKASVQAVLTAGTSSAKIDPYKTIKDLGLITLIVIGILTLIDLYYLKKRAVLRLGVGHLPHMAFLGLSAAILFNMSRGSIL